MENSGPTSASCTSTRESHSRMAVCFLTRATCKNVRQNLIPPATAYLPPTPTLHSRGPLFGSMCTPISTHTKFHMFRRLAASGPQPPHGGSAPSVSAPARFAASPTLQPGTDAVPHPPFRAMSFAASGPPRRELRGCVSVGRWAAGAPGRGTGGRGLGPCLQYRRTCPSSCQCPLDLRDLRLSQCSA